MPKSMLPDTQKPKKPLWPTASLFTMLGLVVGTFIFQVSTDVTVPRMGSWRLPPRVQVCTTAPGWVFNEVEIAVEWWEAQAGEELFSEVVRADCVQLCDPGHNTPRIGEAAPGYLPCGGLGIIAVDVQGAGLPVSHAGQTTTMVWKDQLQWAVVELAALTGPEERARNWTLTHELGHALGYRHAEGRGRMVVKHHVLSPSYTVGGFQTRGLGFKNPDEED